MRAQTPSTHSCHPPKLSPLPKPQRGNPDSLFVFCHPYPALPKRLIETFGKLDSSREQFVIAQTLPCPSLHNFIDAKPFFAAKLLVQQVRIVNNVGNPPHPLVSNAEGFRQRFKRAV